MNKIYLLLGSNQGDRKALFEKAKTLITSQIGLITKSSSLFESEAWGETDQASFLNCVIELESDLEADMVLQQALMIEEKLGRIRMERWKERLIDIDILYFNDAIIDTETLTIPHPEIQNRRFTLVPLCEIVPDLVHPILNQSQFELLKDCNDVLRVWEV